MKQMQDKVESKLKKYPYLLFAAKGIRRIIKRDRDFIEFVLNEYSNPGRISLNTFGDFNYGKIIYGIRECGEGYGFFAELRMALYYLMFAEEKGFEPDIFWGDKHLYYDNEILFTDNVFEYYFEPVKIDTLYQSRNVCFSNVSHGSHIERQYGIDGYSLNGEFEGKAEQIVKKYIHIRRELIGEFNKEAEYIPEQKRLVGIHHRGSDYKSGYDGHPQYVSVEQGIAEAERMMRIYGLDGIFLATDDEKILKEYREYFGNKILYFEDVFRSSSKSSVAFSKNARKCHHYKLGREVLRDVYILSQCRCLISGRSQVGFFAGLFNRCFEEHYMEHQIIDNGLYSSGRRFHDRKR